MLFVIVVSYGTIRCLERNPSKKHIGPIKSHPVSQKLTAKEWNVIKQGLQTFETEVLMLEIWRGSASSTPKYYEQDPQIYSLQIFTTFSHNERPYLFFCWKRYCQISTFFEFLHFFPCDSFDSMHGNVWKARMAWFHGIAWNSADHIVPCMELHGRLMN